MDCAVPTTPTISIGEMPRPSVLLYYNMCRAAAAVIAAAVFAFLIGS